RRSDAGSRGARRLREARAPRVRVDGAVRRDVVRRRAEAPGVPRRQAGPRPRVDHVDPRGRALERIESDRPGRRALGARARPADRGTQGDRMTPTVTSTMTHAADLSTLLPHRAPMVLVDGVEHADCDECVASFAVPAESPWVEDGLLMRAAFVEIAAQTAALHAGLAAREAGGVPRNGYLGMVSRFRVHGDA